MPSLTDLQHPVHATGLQQLESLVKGQVALFRVLRRRAGLRHAYQRRVHEYVALVARKRPVDDLPLHRFRYAAVPFLDPLERYGLGYDPRGDVQQRVDRAARARAAGRPAAGRRRGRAVPAAQPLVGYARAAGAARPFARRHRYEVYGGGGVKTSLLLVPLLLMVVLALWTKKMMKKVPAAFRRTRITRAHTQRAIRRRLRWRPRKDNDGTTLGGDDWKTHSENAPHERHCIIPRTDTTANVRNDNDCTDDTILCIIIRRCSCTLLRKAHKGTTTLVTTALHTGIITEHTGKPE